MAEERVYPVKDPDNVARLQQDFYEKLARNKAAGLQAFQRGEYKPFAGYSLEALRKEFAVILELDKPSQQRVLERVVDPLQKLAQAREIPAIFASSGDLPPHVTLQGGRMKDLSTEQIRIIQEWLLSNKSHLAMLSSILEGLTFHHDTLILAPNSYICASKFDDEQGAPFRVRKATGTMMSRAFGKLSAQTVQPIITGSFAAPYSYYDIFHTSIMRFVGMAPKENVLRFVDQAYETVGEDIQRNPIPVTVSKVFRGTPDEFIQANTPQLLLP